MKIIESKQNSLIKKINSLSVKKYREQLALFVLEGEKVVLEQLKNKYSVDCVLIRQGFKDNYKEIINNFTNCVYLLSDDVFNDISNTVNPQNIMAVIKIEKKDIVNCNSNNILVLDNVQDPGNMGTIIRSAIASGFNNIILINCVDPYNDKTLRSTSGTIFNANLYKLSCDSFIEFANKNNYNIIIAEANKESIFSKNLIVPNKFALVIGNEGNGVCNTIKEHKALSISIPMDAKVESLNASVSASILMFFLMNK